MHQTSTIMFHCVGLDQWPWIYAHISESCATFQRKLKAIKNAGYSTEFFSKAGYVNNDHHKLAVLTFDDGYLDNWVYVLPLLQEEGMKGTVFVNPEFVDPQNILREQFAPGHLFDPQRDSPEDYVGFLSWPEMREMEKSGVMEIQSHAMTHTWYFKGPRIVDFWRPGIATEAGGAGWMLWNKFPEIKPYFLINAKEYESRIPYGTPIYEHDKSLVTRRYYPPEDLTEILVEHVERHGGNSFFEHGSWKTELAHVADKYRDDHPIEAQYESEDDYLARVTWELKESKQTLEAQLDKEITALCWPGGGVNEQVLNIARQVGYKRFTLPSAWQSDQAKNQYADMIPRFGSARDWRAYETYIGEHTQTEFLWRMKAFEGSVLHKWLHRTAMGSRLLWYRFR